MTTAVHAIEKSIVTNVEGKENKRYELLENDFNPQFTRKSITRPYHVTIGRSEYKLTYIRFYNGDGEVFKIGQGWLEKSFGYGDVPTVAIKKDGAYVDIKRKKVESFKSDDVYIISKGKNWSHELCAELYIPIQYLEDMGYQVEQTIHHYEYSTCTRKALVTPLFIKQLSMHNEDHMDKIKDRAINELTEGLNSAESVSDIRDLLAKISRNI